MTRTGYNVTFSPVIDLHCHILPGIDDGPRSIEGSLALAWAAESVGVRTVVATPHVSHQYPNDAAGIAVLVASTGERLRAERIGVELVAGAEIAMTMAEGLSGEELARLGLGGGGWLLVECPFTSLAAGFEMLLSRLQDEGHRVLLAHPERSPLFHRDPALLGALVRGGVATSITAGSLVGSFGGRVRGFARQLAREQLVHNVASDAHDSARRPPGLRAEIERSELSELADWLTQEVPAAILAGEELPPRPIRNLAAGRRPRWWRRER